MLSDWLVPWEEKTKTTAMISSAKTIHMTLFKSIGTVLFFIQCFPFKLSFNTAQSEACGTVLPCSWARHSLCAARSARRKYPCFCSQSGNWHSPASYPSCVFIDISPMSAKNPKTRQIYRILASALYYTLFFSSITLKSGSRLTHERQFGYFSHASQHDAFCIAC